MLDPRHLSAPTIQVKYSYWTKCILICIDQAYCRVCMIRSENKPKNTPASVFSERSIHTTIIYHEFSPEAPHCLKGMVVRVLQ